MSTDRPGFLDPYLPVTKPSLPASFGVGSPALLIVPAHHGTGRSIQIVVTAKARVWITVALADPDTRWLPIERLRLDTQDDGSTSNYPYRFVTPEQHAWGQAHDEALNYLSKVAKIRSDIDSPWRNRSIELARALWVAAQEATA